MRLSTRLLSNAATNYLRLATTVVLGLFTTWYMLGAIGVVGFGLVALASSATGLSNAVEIAFRFGLVRDLAAAIATGDPAALRRCVASAFRLALRTTLLLAGFVLLLVTLALVGFFNTPADQPGLELALAILIFGEGLHAAVRLLSAPYLQSLFAAQRVDLDNLLLVVAKLTYALSAVLVLGWLLPEASLAVKVSGLAVSRVTLQLADVGLGIALARRHVAGLRLEPAAWDEGEYRRIRGTVWHSAQVSLLQGLNARFVAILINLFFGLTYNGLWQIVLQLASFVRMFAEGLLRGLAPVTAHLQEGGRGRAAIELMGRTIRYQLAVSLPAALALGLWAQRLIELWVGGRLAADANLAASGIGFEQALLLTTRLTWIILAWQTVRATFFGVENALFGMGEVRSYAWFSKWSTLIALGLAALLMALTGEVVAAAAALLVAQLCYSAGAVLAAARRRVGLPLAATLRQALPRPLAASLLLLALMVPCRLYFADAGPAGLAALLGAAAAAYGVLGLALVPRPDERARLLELLRHGLRRGRRPEPP